MLPELLIAAILIACIGGKLGRLADAPIKHTWLIAVPAVIYGIGYSIRRFIPGAEHSWIFAVMHTVGILALAVLCILNHRVPGAKLIAAGIILNAVVIFANHGLMPVSKDAMIKVYGEEYFRRAQTMPQVRRTFMDASTQCRVLGDIIAWRGLPSAFKGVYSIGDLVMSVGIFTSIVVLSRASERREKA